VKTFCCNTVGDRRVLIVLTLDVIGVFEKIGNPVNLSGSSEAKASASAAPAQTGGMNSGGMNSGGMNSGGMNSKPMPQMNVKTEGGMNAKPQMGGMNSAKSSPQMGGMNSNQPKRSMPFEAAPEPSSKRQSMGGASPASANIFPIKNLSPYQNKWTIKARVLNKAAVKTWKNARGEGKLFSFSLKDASVCFLRNVLGRDQGGCLWRSSRCLLRSNRRKPSLLHLKGPGQGREKSSI
jgi:replication factor A1